MFDVVPLRAHDLVDDVGPHLLLAGQTRSQQQAEASLVLLAGMGPLQVRQVLLHGLVLVHTQLGDKREKNHHPVRITIIPNNKCFIEHFKDLLLDSSYLC